jgi:DNA-binding GntR family transcriptional regulator
MQDLVSEGIIYRVAGRGTYPVAERDRYVNHFGSVEELMALSLDTECEVVSPLQRKVDVETASRLRLPSDEICHVTLVRRHAGTPFCYTSVYLPPRIGQLLAGTDELATAGRRSRITIIGLIDALLAKSGLAKSGLAKSGLAKSGLTEAGPGGAIATAEQSVSAAGAPAFAAPHLGCDVGEPLLRIDRLYFDADDAPVELAVSYFDPEHYSYRVRLRRRSP